MLRVRIGSSKLTPTELSARRLCSGVDLWRHRGGMSCACPGNHPPKRILDVVHISDSEDDVQAGKLEVYPKIFAAHVEIV